MIDSITGDILFVAYLLDFVLGDPRWLPHPVIYMGKAIVCCEKLWRKMVKNEFAAGVLFAICLIAGTFAGAHFLLKAVAIIHPVAAGAMEILLLFFCLSARSLETAARDVAKTLETGRLQPAREKTAMIVGRQTDKLDEAGITRATVETVAENYVDGFLSPVFFALIAGVPGALAYKMINTLDSMVGYDNDTYRYFGRAAARIDDAANFIPARLSVIFIFLAILCLRPSRALISLKTGLTQGANHKSPNAGYPEAAMAGALAMKLGGPSIYHGQLVVKPFIGKGSDTPVTRHIYQAVDLMLLAAFLAMACACLGLFVFGPGGV